MNANLNHSYNAFLTMLAMDAEADAKALRDMADATLLKDISEGSGGWAHHENATSPATGGLYHGRYDGSVKSPRP